MRARDRDRGSVSIWVLAIGLVVLLCGVAIAGVGAATAARQRAQVAADLGALAGGTDVVVDPAGACTRAGAVVAANGARLLGCLTAAPDIVVTAGVDVPPFGTARAVARAGPMRSPGHRDTHSGVRPGPNRGSASPGGAYGG